MSSDCSNDQWLPHLFPSLQASLFPEKTVLNLGQLIILQWPLSVQMKGRLTHLLTLNQKLDMTELSEESETLSETL